MKKQILEELAKEVSADACKIGKKFSKVAARNLAYLATAPIIGSLNGQLKQRIYNQNTLAVRVATVISGIFNVPLYGTLGDLAGHGEDGMIYGLAELVFRAAVSFFGDDSDNPFSRSENTSEEIESNQKYNLGSVIGYFPGRITSYLFERYDNAKNKIEGKNGKWVKNIALP